MLNNIDILSAGAAPLIAAYCREIDLPQITNNVVRWDEKQWNVTPGDLLMAMVINLLVDRAPLYRISNFYINRDLDILFGKDKMTLSALNDRHFGTLLDRIYEAGPESLYHTLTAAAITTHDVDVSQLHSDTTSKAVQGAYDTDDGSINITYGHSKDNRPDLKQFLYGLIVAEGVPISAKVMDGNTSDKTWNKEIITELANIFPQTIAKDMLYIADSAMVTKDALQKLMNQAVKFISRLPSTYKLVDALKEQALLANNWDQIGTFSANNNAAEYKVWETTETLYDHEYRFVVVHSSALAAKKAKTMDRTLAKEKISLAKQCQKLSERTFACEADAIAELSKFEKAQNKALHTLLGRVYSITQSIKRQGRGRPPIDYVPKQETVWCIDCQVGKVKQDVVNTQLEKSSMFILITNQLDHTTLNTAEILEKYKAQNSVEIRFRWLKDPTIVKQIWLETPKRVMALGFVFLISLLIYCLLERKVRQNLAEESKPIRLHGNRITKKPTGVAFLQLFTDIVTVISIDENNNYIRGLPPRYNDSAELNRALLLAGFDLDIYTSIPS